MRRKYITLNQLLRLLNEMGIGCSRAWIFEHRKKYASLMPEIRENKVSLYKISGSVGKWVKDRSNGDPEALKTYKDILNKILD